MRRAGKKIKQGRGWRVVGGAVLFRVTFKDLKVIYQEAIETSGER